MGSDKDEKYRAVGGRELRDLLCVVLADGVARTSHEMLLALRLRGAQPRGADYKGRIRNLHALASGDDRIVKVRPGVFALRR